MIAFPDAICVSNRAPARVFRLVDALSDLYRVVFERKHQFNGCIGLLTCL